MYLVAGDSWGCGEWVPQNPDVVLDPPRGHYELSLVHRGLAEYLEQHDTVINISKPGAGNFDVLQRIRLFLDINYNYVPEIKKIFVFQTSWWRDFVLDYFHCWLTDTKNLHRNFEWRLEYACDQTTHPLLQLHINRDDKLEYNLTTKWYQDLNFLAQDRGLEIVVIGGLSDILPDSEDMSNLKFGCSSMVNLALNNSEYPQVASAGGFIPDELVKIVVDICRLDKKQMLNYLDKFEIRTKLLKERLDLFPDGHHGNRECHLKVYQLLQKKSLLGL